MIDLIIGISFVLLVGLAETQCKKNERLLSFCFLVALCIAYAVSYSDWTYLLYPVGICISFFGWQMLNQKRRELKMKKENTTC